MIKTNNFNEKEFYSQGKTKIPPQYTGNLIILMNQLQVLRDWLGHPIKITSGYRTPEHNKNVGGMRTSRHLYAQAADIKMAGMTGPQLHKLILEAKTRGMIPYINGIGVYDVFVHVDVRATAARWDGTT